jgi:hypothetical protein
LRRPGSTCLTLGCSDGGGGSIARWRGARQAIAVDAKRPPVAYIQTLIGYKVKLDMPQLTGDEVERLCARGKPWLTGGPLD